jgi:transposase
MATEIISTVERRRQWPTEEKLRIMSEALAPGATIAATADRHGVCRSQLYTWLRLAREGKLPGISMCALGAPSFVSVQIGADAPPSSSPPASGDPAAIPVTSPCPSASSPLRGRRPAMVEVVLTNGRIIKVDETIDPDAFARLVAVLDGGRT